MYHKACAGVHTVIRSHHPSGAAKSLEWCQHQLSNFRHLASQLRPVQKLLTEENPLGVCMCYSASLTEESLSALECVQGILGNQSFSSSYISNGI